MVSILFQLAFVILTFFEYAIIAVCVFSVLASFGVLDTRNRIVWTIGDFLARVTEPVLRPIRRILPNFGGIDLSPFVVLILIQVVAFRLLADLETAIITGSVQPLLL